ncbi:hypothetical protein LJR225_001168 [Phenylobacterium sp. LjRoot225]
MKPQPSYAATPVRRDLLDSRSTGGPAPQTNRKTLLNDRRSTR